MLRNEKFPSVSRYTCPGVNADGWVEIYLRPALTVVSLSGISHATQPFDLSGDDQHGERQTHSSESSAQRDRGRKSLIFAKSLVAPHF